MWSYQFHAFSTSLINYYFIPCLFLEIVNQQARVPSKRAMFTLLQLPSLTEPTQRKFQKIKNSCHGALVQWEYTGGLINLVCARHRLATLLCVIAVQLVSARYSLASRPCCRIMSHTHGLSHLHRSNHVKRPSVG